MDVLAIFCLIVYQLVLHNRRLVNLFTPSDNLLLLFSIPCLNKCEHLFVFFSLLKAIFEYQPVSI